MCTSFKNICVYVMNQARLLVVNDRKISVFLLLSHHYSMKVSFDSYQYLHGENVAFIGCTLQFFTQRVLVVD